MAGNKDTRKAVISTWPLAVSKINRQNRKRQTTKDKAPKTKTRRKKPPVVTIEVRPPMEFPQVRGKSLEDVKLYVDSDETTIALTFTDKTDLQFDIEPGLIVRTAHTDWSVAGGRTIKSWPALRNPSIYVKDR